MRCSGLAAKSLFSLSAVLFSAPGPLPAVDFIRGDVNSDGVLTISDAHAASLFLFHRQPIPCRDALDFNDDGTVNLTDTIELLGFQFLGGDAPPPPFPAPGPDPTANQYGSAHACDSYGAGSPLPDVEARLAVLDASAAGGAQSRAVITVALSSPRGIAGYSGTIRFPDGLITHVESPTHLTSGIDDYGYLSARLTEGGIRFSFMSTLSRVQPIAAGQDVPVLEVPVCLKQGTAAGSHALTLEAAELADWDTGRAIHPSLGSGTLTVGSSVAGGDDCGPPPPPPPPPPPEEMNAVYKLGSRTAAPGARVALPFFIRANAGIQGYAFSVDFDEEVLELLPVDEVWPRPDGLEYGFKVFEFNNRNDHPGSAGVDEGFVIGAAVFDQRRPLTMPAATDNLARVFHFRVNEAITAGSTEVSFLDGGQVSGDPIRNFLTSRQKSYTPELASSFLFLNGVITVLDDITVFVRGDSNGDDRVDVSDPQATLSYLFLGTAQPACFDAADFNDDGTINVADPIATLYFLYLDNSVSPPQPFRDAGADPTEDGMGCLFRYR